MADEYKENPLENTNDLDKIYHTLNERASKLYKFVSLFQDYYTIPRDYDNSGRQMNMVEIHTITAIEENPGISITKLAEEQRRTKGAVSQIVAKLETKELIYKQRSEESAKHIGLYATEEGTKLSKAHKQFDIRQLQKTMKYLLRDCSEEELISFYKVIEHYNTLLEKGNQKQKEKNIEKDKNMIEKK